MVQFSLSNRVALILLIPLWVADVSTAQNKREVRAIGCFANVRSDGEHADGYSVKLWSWNGEIIGTIDYHRGLAGDPPIGLLNDIRYDPQTRKISFKAKLTSGLHYCREHKGVPSRDLLSFEGTLDKDRLKGKLTVSDQLDLPSAAVDSRDDFFMRLDEGCRPHSYENYEIWWWYREPVFKSRGPGW